MDTAHVNKESLRLTIHYSRSLWKRNYLSNDVSYAKFNKK